ncbi:hypothetical protein QUB00_19695 [Microcoleus sp. F8_C2]
MICGIPKGVESLINLLHVLGFAEVGEWSPPLPSPISGEVMRILTETIQDTRHAIDRSRNKKPVSDKRAERIYLAQVNSLI